MFSDDFNRPDGPVGNGWSAWEAGTWIENGQVRAGGTNNGGGVCRTLTYPLGSPMTFEFDFSSRDSAGWAIQGNTTNPGLWSFDDHPRLFAFMQHRGDDGIRYAIGDHIVSHDWQFSPNARPWTEGVLVHIAGVVYPDMRAEITVDYRDGSPVALYQWLSHQMDPATVTQGTLFSIGNSNDTGRAYLDNLMVAPEPATLLLLAVGGLAVIRRRR
jgi:hypothetical protein